MSLTLELLTLLACPACAGSLLLRDARDARDPRDAEIVCASCDAGYPIAEGVPALVTRGSPGGDDDRRHLRSEGARDEDATTRTVREFYTQSPFPGYPPRLSFGGLRARAERSEFARLLDRAIPTDARVVEVGCGTGQMSLYLASAERLVIGADLTRASLELGARARARFGVGRLAFVETNLLQPGLRHGAFDVVYSSGVLHHTRDPEASFASIVRLAKPGGIVVLGLYNAYARVPHLVRRTVARATGLRWFPFDPIVRDRAAEPARREAWIRDQYLHPEEHRHTIAEVRRWFARAGVEFLRTYPSALVGEDDDAKREQDLFAVAEDDWGFEAVLAQIAWANELAHEGGLWVTVGRVGEGRAAVRTPTRGTATSPRDPRTVHSP